MEPYENISYLTTKEMIEVLRRSSDMWESDLDDVADRMESLRAKLEAVTRERDEGIVVARDNKEWCDMARKELEEVKRERDEAVRQRDEVWLSHSDEDIARYFHEEYERLAPRFGYETREESRVPWEDVPNRDLMIATTTDVRLRMVAKATKAAREGE